MPVSGRTTVVIFAPTWSAIMAEARRRDLSLAAWTGAVVRGLAEPLVLEHDPTPSVTGVTAAVAASAIAAELAEGRPDQAFRSFISYSDALAKADAAGRVILSAATPATTDDAAWDAALAAATEYWLDAATAPKPAWLADPWRRLDAPQTLSYSRYVEPPDPAEVPPQFIARNILVASSTLESV